jgi:hypothetical protein
MEENEMSKSDLIVILTAIRETANTNGENKTVEFVDKLIEASRK